MSSSSCAKRLFMTKLIQQKNKGINKEVEEVVARLEHVEIFAKMNGVHEKEGINTLHVDTTTISHELKDTSLVKNAEVVNADKEVAPITSPTNEMKAKRWKRIEREGEARSNNAKAMVNVSGAKRVPPPQNEIGTNCDMQIDEQEPQRRKVMDIVVEYTNEAENLVEVAGPTKWARCDK